MRHDPAALLLFRPVNQQELDLIAAADWRAFPPRRSGQAFFLPVLHETHAARLAEDRAASGDIGYVVRFALDADYAATFAVQRVGTSTHPALHVPASELSEFNQQILGTIEVVAVAGAA